MEKTLFQKIFDGDLPGVIVYKDDRHVVLMDKFPAIPGQTLVLPRAPVDYLFAMDDASYAALWQCAKHVARAMDAAFSPRRVCVVVEGFDVPHVHIRLYPVPEGKPLTTKPLGPADDAELRVFAEKIKAKLGASA